MSTRSLIRPDVRRVRERAAEGLASLEHPEWADAFPWLVQGTTTRGDPEGTFDFALFGAGADPRASLASWASLRLAVGARRVVHARQVHGAVVRVHGLELLDHRAGAADVPGPAAEPSPAGERRRASGLHLDDPCDAHVTAHPGLLLAVTTADCVPVFLVDPERRAVGLAHAGWRGAAAGVLEHALDAMSAADLRGPGRRATASSPAELHVHLGPAICGRCYEVGAEVFGALGLREPDAPTPLDLRAVLAGRAIARGVRPSRITVSEHCTLCTGSGLFSHRGGDTGRQVGYLGIRP